MDLVRIGGLARNDGMINRVKGYGGKWWTGDGRVRSESWQAFWIGSERLSEMGGVLAREGG